MPINRHYTFPLLYIKDNKVKTIYSYITLLSNINLKENNSINKINNYIFINLLINIYKENIIRVVIRDKVLRYLYRL